MKENCKPWPTMKSQTSIEKNGSKLSCLKVKMRKGIWLVGVVLYSNLVDLKIWPLSWVILTLGFHQLRNQACTSLSKMVLWWCHCDTTTSTAPVSILPFHFLFPLHVTVRCWFFSSQGHTPYLLPNAAQSPLAQEEIVSISIIGVLVICFVLADLSLATKMKWDTQTKLIINTGAFRA